MIDTELYRLTMLQAEEIYKGAQSLPVAELSHRTGFDVRTLRKYCLVSPVGISKSAYAQMLCTKKKRKEY